MLDEIAAAEGGTSEETTYDGRKLRWTQDARKALRSLGDNYQRRRAKARIEKSARSKRLDTITLDLAKRFIEEETGVLYRPAEGDEAMSAADKRRAAEAEAAGEEAVAHDEPLDDSELKILARDRKGKPLLSRLAWSEKAIERVLRVPAGFMRDRTQNRIEELAGERDRRDVDLELVEEGITFGLEQMKAMIGAYGGASPEMKKHDDADGEQPAAKADGAEPAAEECPVPEAERAADEPASAEASPTEPDNRGFVDGKPTLNEIGVMTEMEKRRRGELGSSG